MSNYPIRVKNVIVQATGIHFRYWTEEAAQLYLPIEAHVEVTGWASLLFIVENIGSSRAF